MAKSETQFAAIAASGIGDSTLVGAVTAPENRKIRVLGVSLVASGGANTVRFESGAGGTALTGLIDLAADGQWTLPPTGHGWFETAAGALLNLELTAAGAVAGCLVYEEVY